MKYIFHSLIIAATAFGTVSCNKSYLDVSKELAEDRDMQKIFSTPADVRKWHRNIYAGIPNLANYSRNDITGLDNPWLRMTDEVKLRQVTEYNLAPYTLSHSTWSRWALYQYIRQANIFLANAVEIPASGLADFVDAAELAELKVQARFLRAYYHYLLFELYGPVTIMTDVADPNSKNLDYARNSVDEVVNFVYDELTACIAELKDPDLTKQELLALPTKGTALAIRARLMMYAASPLFNGGYSEALAVTNKDGKRLFPDADPAKWDKALEAVKAVIDYAESGHYALHREMTGTAYDPDKSLYELHMKYNKEIIFARSDVNWGSVPTVGVDGWSVPRGARGGSNATGYIAATQELVDAFFMNDGLPIDESPKYSETGMSEAGDDVTGRTTPGTFRMYVNREPRFYQAIFYNGRRWHVGNEEIWFNKDGNSDNRVQDHARTGYIFYKKLSKRVYNQGSHPKSEYRPGIIHRLAEFYLLYAEVLNEVRPSDPNIITYIDKVRERAGIPLLADIKPQIRGNQVAQREAVRAEMRVELAGEGQRYFDVRRWMIAENPSGKGAQGGPYYGMDMNAPTLEGFYKRTVIENRGWTRAMYLYPIPLNDIQNSRLLVQNPGY
ncbi:RagB/SusD family nutrient uptake outer membrane protein [Chitinophaga pollutisoli]|uniref:RagB/SusD family nutrient uptake outer membrane protein n=1 Tax=Chitinophaga pollutisoli TaxID=3133966 RepID=A0ABZ2YQ31_9BACT